MRFFRKQDDLEMAMGVIRQLRGREHISNSGDNLGGIAIYAVFLHGQRQLLDKPILNNKHTAFTQNNPFQTQKQYSIEAVPSKLLSPTTIKRA